MGFVLSQVPKSEGPGAPAFSGVPALRNAGPSTTVAEATFAQDDKSNFIIITNLI